MKIYKKVINFSLIIILLNFPISYVHSKTAPSSFADLAEKLMPSGVNIASTQTIQTTSNLFNKYKTIQTIPNIFETNKTTSNIFNKHQTYSKNF